MNCQTQSCFENPDDDPRSVSARRERVCQFLITERQFVDRLLGKTLGANPHWDILLDLYLANFEGRLVYQSALAPAAPPAYAHRQSARLAKLGAVKRTLDPQDHRRMNVTLSAEVRTALDTLMDLLAVHVTETDPRD